jgi:hypothetical protein
MSNNIKLNKSNSVLGKKYVYLMHLSYGRKNSVKPLFDYSLNMSVIGIDDIKLHHDWNNFTDKQKHKFSDDLRWQFERFCNFFKVNDVVIAVEGQKKLLGICKIVGDYKFDHKRPVNKWENKDWSYFRFTRPVKWTIFNKPVPFNVPGFRNVIREINESDVLWKKLKRFLENKIVNLNTKDQKYFKYRNDSTYKVSDEGGTSIHSRREMKLVNFAAKYFKKNKALVTDLNPIDLQVSKPNKVIFEAKVIEGNGEREGKFAIGQLLWYQYRWVKGEDVFKCVLFDKKPSFNFVNFVETELKIGVVWKRNNYLCGGPYTYKKLVKLGIKKR